MSTPGLKQQISIVAAVGILDVEGDDRAVVDDIALTTECVIARSRIAANASAFAAVIAT